MVIQNGDIILDRVNVPDDFDEYHRRCVYRCTRYSRHADTFNMSHRNCYDDGLAKSIIHLALNGYRQNRLPTSGFPCIRITY